MLILFQHGIFCRVSFPVSIVTVREQIYIYRVWVFVVYIYCLHLNKFAMPVHDCHVFQLYTVWECNCLLYPWLGLDSKERNPCFYFLINITASIKGVLNGNWATDGVGDRELWRVTASCTSSLGATHFKHCEIYLFCAFCQPKVIWSKSDKHLSSGVPVTENLAVFWTAQKYSISNM